MKTEVLSPTPTHIERAAEALKHAQLVGMPTETVYGLAGNVFSEEALSRIFQAKERPTFDPLIVHVSATAKPLIEALENLRLVRRGALAGPLRALTEKFLARFWPGPLTVVLPKDPRVPDLATSGMATVAIRMPAHPVARALIAAAGTPLAAPSANRFGRISPTCAEDVQKELGGRIPLILDGGPSLIGLESTVVAVDPGAEASEAFSLLRPGGISREEIERTIGVPLQDGKTIGASPGMLPHHYAPSKPLILLPDRISRLTERHWESILSRTRGHSALGLLIAMGDPESPARDLTSRTHNPVTALSLARTDDVEEAAHAFFGTLRKLDESGATLLLAEPPPWKGGLGYALLDRLKRAADEKNID